MISPSYSQFHNLEMFSVVPGGRSAIAFNRMWLNTGESWSGESGKEKEEREKKGRWGWKESGGGGDKKQRKKKTTHVCRCVCVTHILT